MASLQRTLGLSITVATGPSLLLSSPLHKNDSLGSNLSSPQASASECGAAAVAGSAAWGDAPPARGAASPHAAAHAHAHQLSWQGASGARHAGGAAGDEGLPWVRHLTGGGTQGPWALPPADALAASLAAGPADAGAVDAAPPQCQGGHREQGVAAQGQEAPGRHQPHTQVLEAAAPSPSGLAAPQAPPPQRPQPPSDSPGAAPLVQRHERGQQPQGAAASGADAGANGEGEPAAAAAGAAAGDALRSTASMLLVREEERQELAAGQQPVETIMARPVRPSGAAAQGAATPLAQKPLPCIHVRRAVAPPAALPAVAPQSTQL